MAGAFSRISPSVSSLSSSPSPSSRRAIFRLRLRSPSLSFLRDHVVVGRPLLPGTAALEAAAAAALALLPVSASEAGRLATGDESDSSSSLALALDSFSFLAPLFLEDENKENELVLEVAVDLSSFFGSGGSVEVSGGATGARGGGAAAAAAVVARGRLAALPASGSPSSSSSSSSLLSLQPPSSPLSALLPRREKKESSSASATVLPPLGSTGGGRGSGGVSGRSPGFFLAHPAAADAALHLASAAATAGTLAA